MDPEDSRTDLPILILYNLDPTWPQEDIHYCAALAHQMKDSLVEVGHPVQEVCVTSAEIETALAGFDPGELVLFNWCEELPGVPHSAARVAETLEQLGFIFTGASAQALAINQDKRLVKRLLQGSQIPTPAWQVYEEAAQTIHWRHFPAIVKPAFEHCSYGITRESVVQSTAELVRQVHYVLDELHQPALVEEFIDGREFHVGVIGNGKLRVLPPAEIDYSSFDDIHDRLCTYEANFIKDSRAYQFTVPRLPVVLTEDQLGQLEEVVTAAYQATDCRDYARMDIRLRDGVFYLLDVNTNADMSPDTSLVMAAELAGFPYGKLVSLLINLAARRHPKYSSGLREKGR